MRMGVPRVTVGAAVGAALFLSSLPACHLGAGFSEAACTGETFSLAEAMVPTFEYAELRESQGGFAGAGAGAGGRTSVLATAGEKCKSAKDKPACVTRFTEAKAESGFANLSHGRMPGHRYLVVTRGDEVLVVDEHTKTVGAALAPIDSATKAAATASISRNLVPKCRSSVRRAGTSFEVHLTSDSCFGPVDEIVRVTPDGSVEVVKSERKPATCVGTSKLRSSSSTDG